jgi:hypothetical protein
MALVALPYRIRQGQRAQTAGPLAALEWLEYPIPL